MTGTPAAGALALALLAAAGCASQPAPPGPSLAVQAQAQGEVRETLERLHQAASEADEEAYFELFASDAVFMGTDPQERWTLDEFRAWCRPYFAAGRGWTYVPQAQHVQLSADGQVAWFDERLLNTTYGECRGTGVAVLLDGRWRIAQYSLSLPVPNELAADLVERIRGLPAEPPARAEDGPKTAPPGAGRRAPGADTLSAL